MDDEVGRDGNGLPLENNLFPRRKDDQFDRVLCDRRASNRWEELLCQPRLPHGSQFAGAILRPDEVFRFSKKDLPD